MNWCSMETIRCPFQVYEISNWLFEKCSCLTHTFIFQFTLHNFYKWCFHQYRQRGFSFSPLCSWGEQQSACLAGRHSLLLLHLVDIILKSSSESNLASLQGQGSPSLGFLGLFNVIICCQSVSGIFVTQTPEPNFSRQKGQSFFTERTDFFFLSARFLSEEKFTALCPRPDLVAPLPSHSSGPVDSVWAE